MYFTKEATEFEMNQNIPTEIGQKRKEKKRKKKAHLCPGRVATAKTHGTIPPPPSRVTRLDHSHNSTPFSEKPKKRYVYDTSANRK